MSILATAPGASFRFLHCLGVLLNVIGLMRELFSLLPLQQGNLFRLDSCLFVALCSCQLVLPFDKFCIGPTLVVLSLCSSSSLESCSDTLTNIVAALGKRTHTCTDWCGFVLLHFISADFNGKCFPNSILMLFYVRTARLAGVGNFECDCPWSDELCMFSCLELFFIRLEPTEQEHRK